MISEAVFEEIEGAMEGVGKGAGAFVAEVGVDGFESADEVQNVPPGVWATGWGAKMGAASKGTVLIDEAASGEGIEKRAGTVFGFGEGFSSGGSEGFCGEQSFSLGELGDESGALEVAAFRAQLAVAFGLAGGEVGINLPDFAKGLIGKERHRVQWEFFDRINRIDRKWETANERGSSEKYD